MTDSYQKIPVSITNEKSTINKQPKITLNRSKTLFNFK
jgi:hypothetical protein